MFSTFLSNEVLLKAKQQRLNYTCFRVFETFAQFDETIWNTLNLGHVKESKLLNSMFHNNWVLNPGTRHVRVELYLFYSTLDIRAICGNWVQILQIISCNTWKIIQNLEDLLDWQSHLGIEFDLVFGILGIMTLRGKLGPNALDNWLGNTKNICLREC